LVVRRTVDGFFRERPPQRRILEVGGGIGMLRPALVRACRPEQLVCSDIDASEATDLVCDATALPFANDCFDTVAAFEVLEHIPDTERFLSEVLRVTRPGGHLVLSVPFLFGRHDYRDYYRFTPDGLAWVLGRHNAPIRVMRKSGGICVALLAILTEFVRGRTRPASDGWRSRRVDQRRHLAVTTILTAPLVTLSWAALAADAVFDRDSDHPTGLVLIAEKGG
jgi:SAM-dependent methyltransferase